MLQLVHSADRRTLLWMLVLMPGLVAVQYANPALVPYLSWVSFYFAISSAVVAHNHQHCPIFKRPALNHAFADWISVFYGYPTFAWIPTHNLNHHRRVNKPGDATITWRFTNQHNLLVAATYFFVSAYYQAEPINAFIRQAKERRPAQYRRIIRQYVIVFGSQGALLALAVALYGVGPGVKLWALTLGLPAFTALWTVMLFNYEQHVHTDPWSKRNHSRNFVSKLLNFLLFNNGLHTAHHEKADLHWSLLPALHATFAAEIDPELKQQSLWWYWCKQYVLSPIFPKLGTQQIGRAPFDVPNGEKSDLSTDSVGLAEIGTSEARA
jgi:beta-carotene hydroxylase